MNFNVGKIVIKAIDLRKYQELFQAYKSLKDDQAIFVDGITKGQIASIRTSFSRLGCKPTFRSLPNGKTQITKRKGDSQNDDQ